MARDSALTVILTAEKFDLDDELERYARRKFQDLEKYIPRHARPSAQLEVRLKRTHAKDKQVNVCSVTLYLPKASLHAAETTEHMYTAVDVATVSIRQQVVTYKTEHESARSWHRLGSPFGKGNYPA